jgi:anti-sigma regulatory factor (Ser/Thr protein kinase)
MFATLFFGILDPDTNLMYYVNGGHEPPIVVDQRGMVIQRLMPTGPAIGFFPDMKFRVEQFHFNEGDFLVGFTDGTTDARNVLGKTFSEARLLKSVAEPWTSVFSMLFELNIELQKHMGEQNQFDDITLLSFRRKSSMAGDRHAICRPAQINFLEELRRFTESAALHCGLIGEDVFAFKLVVDELCTNIIQYGYQGREPGTLSISFVVEDNSARLIIQDDGKYFPPNQAKSPKLDAGWDEREIGGLGLFFVRELMDSVTYKNLDENTNQFILEKELKK